MKFKSNIEIQAGVEAGGSTGSSGQVLSSTGTGAAWVDASTVIGGPYLPLTGGTMTGNLTLSYAYPRINLYDTDNNSDYSIINNDGSFSIYDVTNNSHRLSIAPGGNATFAGNISALNFSGSSSGTNTGDQDLSGYLLNTTVATNTKLGLIKLFNNTDQTVAANAVTTIADRTYGLQLNSSNQAVINVPWTDTNTWRANAVDSDGYVAAGSGRAHKVWKTDATGNPFWRDDADTTYSVGDGGLTEINFTTAYKDAVDANTAKVSDTGTPAILSNGTTPTLNTGITDAEIRTLIGAGTGNSNFSGNYDDLDDKPTTISAAQATAITANTAKVSDTGVPAILSDGSVPTLNTGITAEEVRTLIGAGTSSTDTTYTAGGGINIVATTINHADTSSQASVNNSGRTYVQDIALDTYGHITSITSATETVVDTGTPAILSNGSTPSLNTGITAAEVRALIGAGTSSTTGTVTGSGTTNYVPRFTSSTALGNSVMYNTSSSVGIGTTNPEYELDVNGTTASHKFIAQFVGDEVAYTANIGNDDNTGGWASGPASFAGGSGNAVLGWKSIANGTNNRTGNYSLESGGVNSAAFGLNNVAQNSESIALGRTNTSSGVASVAAGDTLTASGNHSFACNINNTASGDGAIAGGFGTVASGDYSVSLGINTTATQPQAFVIGDNCDATAARAFATGLNSVASGQNAVVHGNNNVAGGTNSFVSGANSTVIGFNSTALGNNLSVTSGAGTAVGIWNQDTGNYRFQVGVGTSNANRVNAFSITNNGVILAHVLKNSSSYSNDSQAAAGGVPIGGLYRNGSIVQIRIT
jgi:trimeric autotransporter adhesin